MSSWDKKKIKRQAGQLVEWFEENARPLPWRQSRDPYRIWISEIMLQQTTVQAVIPFYQRFVKSFPNVKRLAKASIEEVYDHWAGLGYYSRARNIHAAAQVLSQMKSFPEDHSQLLKLPGFGDYTARAVSSQAFGEPVGVVDGNVIRVLSRLWGLPVEHWKTKEKRTLQELADHYATYENPSEINQAFMELGATICTAQSPTCFLCPVKKHCVALSEDRISELPLKKPKRASEIWWWQPVIHEQDGKLAFIDNQYAPFLKQLILPGTIEHKKTPPDQFDFQHAITHHKIYVTVTRKKSNFKKLQNSNFTWISRKRLKEKVPFSLIQKAIDIGLGDNKK